MYDPDRSHEPMTAQEVGVCQWTQPTPVAIGSHVMYRHRPHGDVVDAIVTDLVHDYPENTIVKGLVVPLPQWPTLLLETVYGEVKTREARARGSAGWLPLDWYKSIPAHVAAA